MRACNGDDELGSPKKVYAGLVPARRPVASSQASCKILGCLRTKSSRRKAAPVGCRRPFSQLIAVTFGTLSKPANTAWLTLS